MVIPVFFVVQWYVSLFCQTFFLHRYAAHGMFSMSKRWEKFFFIFTYLAQGSNYLSAYGYGILHRLHHNHADTENDPHSPSFSSNIFSMMWRTKEWYSNIMSGTYQPDAKLKKDVPEWKSFDRFADGMWSRLLWSAAYIVFFYFFATAWWHWLFLPVTLAMAPVHGAIINWFAHKVGYRNFPAGDTSTNFLPVDVLMMGESYHNNHHVRASSPNFGFKWHELDPTYLIILVLNKLNIIQLNKATMVKAEVSQKESARV